MKPAIFNTIFSWLRYQAFWFVDFIKGNPVKKHYQNITNTLEKTYGLGTHTETELQKLLVHAVETVPHYKTVSPHKIDLKYFPVVDKGIISSTYADFKSSIYKDKKTILRKTSGSTGTPFTVDHDVNKVYRNTADNLYFSKKAGYKIGYRLYYLRHWNAAYSKSKLANWLQNVIPIEVVGLENKGIPKLLKTLGKSSGKISVLGFPSSLEQICKYLDNTPSYSKRFNINSAIAMAEALNSYTKKRMQHYFNVTVLSRYSNMEAGILAQQTLNSTNVFKLNFASYHFEILDINNDQPVAKGTLGRIVITDLFNYAMPLIRYDTGDLGIIEELNGDLVCTKIEGRKSDAIYDTKGKLVSSFMMTEIVNYTNINQIQFIQYGKTSYELKISVAKKFNEEQELLKMFKSFLGEDAILKINYVDDIPLLSSGKRKYTYNIYNSN